MSKHSIQSLPRPVSDYVKVDSHPHLRIPVEVAAGTQAFTFVDYYGTRLLALTPEENGSVLVQPRDCVISLKHVDDNEITKAGGLLRIVTDGAPRNIIYLDKYGNTIIASALDGYEPLPTGQSNVVEPKTVDQDYTRYLAEWMNLKSDDDLRAWLETKGVTDKPQSRNEIAKVIYDNNLQNESSPESVLNAV